MISLKRITWFAAFLGALFVCASSAHAGDIGGTISSTLTITEDSQLVDDVTCTVTGAPCIAIGAPKVTLELNGFTITGQADLTFVDLAWLNSFVGLAFSSLTAPVPRSRA